jgi:cation transport regulator
MPFSTIGSLPTNLQRILPKHAQSIYKAAFNNAYDEYKNPKERRGDEGREEVAHKVAWSAVKENYVKGEDNKWHQK